jgi:alkyl sulfatase BDS1-like metallo-beta-lactamase superfamily hydrolase
MAALTVTQLFDSIAIRIDARRAWSMSTSILWHFTDLDETYRMELSNGVLIHHRTRRQRPATLAVTLTKPQLLALLGGGGHDDIGLEGDPAALTTILSVLDEPDPAFAIVTP